MAMTDKNDDQVKNDADTTASDTDETSNSTAAGSNTGKSKTTEGVQWEQTPDPMASVKKGAAEVLDKMEGKTVSMKIYVGSIVGVILLMLLARCGG
jgi:hypothetical protein